MRSLFWETTWEKLLTSLVPLLASNSFNQSMSPLQESPLQITTEISKAIQVLFPENVLYLTISNIKDKKFTVLNFCCGAAITVSVLCIFLLFLIVDKGYCRFYFFVSQKWLHLWLCRLLFKLISITSEKAMAPHCSTLAWKIPRTEEPGGLQSLGR